MNTYEALYIMDNGLADETKESLIAKFNAVISDNGGTVDSCEKWGVKKLAYPIDFKTEGYYVLINFTAPATPSSRTGTCYENYRRFNAFPCNCEVMGEAQ